MGVYIKCIEMPTTEQGVRTINIYADGVVTNYAEVTIGKAVPVPTHGRLVDADRLLSERMKRTYYHLPNGDTAIPIIDVEHAPTIIPASEEGE